MLINPYKALFVHIPKTAGQSIENFFLQKMGKNREEDGADFFLKPNTDLKKGPPRLAHLSVLEYLKYEYISEVEFQHYYKFAFVRNPFDRVISFYKFYGFHALISLNTFVISYLPYYFKTEFWFFKNQADFIYDNNKLLVDFVGKFESLDEDFSIVAKELTIKKHNLPESNISERPKFISRKTLNLIKKHPTIIFYLNLKKQNDYRSTYNLEAKKIVSNLYEKDLKILNYKF